MYYTEEEQKKIRQAQDDTIRRIGREEGYAEGIAEGEAKVISKFLASGMSVSSVAEILGITEEECKQLLLV